MNKQRLEALSDGIFAVGLTILVFEIRVPKFDHSPVTNAELWQALVSITPVFISYYISFLVLALFWISHHAFYRLLDDNLNRNLVLLNFLYLCMIAFVPFSAYLIGTYSHNELAFVIYGLNMLALGGLTLLMLKYAVTSKEINTRKITPALFHQFHRRLLLTTLFSGLGTATAFISIPLALFFFGSPILFNLIPGSANLLEKEIPLK